MPELLSDDDSAGDPASTTYPTLTRRTYPVFYRAMLQELVHFAKALTPGKQSEPMQVCEILNVEIERGLGLYNKLDDDSYLRGADHNACPSSNVLHLYVEQ